MQAIIAQLKYSCHRVITTAEDDRTGKVYTLLSVQIEQGALDELISFLEQHAHS